MRPATIEGAGSIVKIEKEAKYAKTAFAAFAFFAFFAILPTPFVLCNA